MSFETKINDEIKNAMKSGDKLRLDTLRSIRASIIEFSKSGSGKELDDEEAMKILLNQAKRRRDAIELYNNGGRSELAEREQMELDIIEEFLPKQATEDEIRDLVEKRIQESGADGMKDMGKVMGPVMQELKGRADGKTVQEIVKEKLGSM